MEQETDKQQTNTTPPEPYLIDNRGLKLVDYLRAKFNKAKTLRVVSAYFNIYGYEALREQLKKVERVRFLYGEPTSADNVDPRNNEYKAYWIHDKQLAPRQTLRQKQLAADCQDWLKKSSVEVRSIKRSNFLHGKMYISETTNDNEDSAVVGSSNFTGSGLGSSANPNLEINVASTDKSEINQLKNWFDELWNDDTQTEDVKRKVMAALGRLGEDQSPEIVYYKTLYEVFKDELDRLGEGDDQPPHIKRLDQTEIWKQLYAFQRDGYLSIINKLEQLNGCILADSVGLGKTYTALAVIKHFELKYNANVLVLCPKKLENNWKRFTRIFGLKSNPFVDDGFQYKVLAHTDLSRTEGHANGIDLEKFDWSGFNLVVIDESHNFRNATSSKKDENGKPIRSSRYDKLLDEVIREGGNTKVLMLSATPVNISFRDLRNQLYLMTARSPYALREPLGIFSYESVLKEAQKKFENWAQGSRRPDKHDMVGTLGGDLFRLINGVSVARSRRQIEKHYESDLQIIGTFPEAMEPEKRTPPTDHEKKLSYDDLNEDIGNVSLALYNPSDYLPPDMQQAMLNVNESSNVPSNLKFRLRSESNFTGIMRVNLLKRLESSVDSFVKTLQKILDDVKNLEARIADFERTGDPEMTVKEGPQNEKPQNDKDEDNDEGEELELSEPAKSYRLKDLDLKKYKEQLEKDRELLTQIRDKAKCIGPDRDGKLKALRQDIRNRAAMPTVDKDGNSSRKMLIFTTFKDTGNYLYENLQKLAAELRLNIAFVSGTSVETEFGKEKFDDVLDNFAPVARGRNPDSEEPEIDLLIATDCISEGQNLQDCDLVVNYDIHWNPVRLIQRFGRIDRIGSRYEHIRMINYWPTDDMDYYLNLRKRVETRMVLADVAATGDSNILDKNQVEYDLERRDEQLLLQFGGEAPDPDDASGGLNFSDLSLDHFIHQIWNYLDRYRDELEKMPNGIYAVVKATTERDEGVIFVLKHTKQLKATATKYNYSPVMPYYLIHLSWTGQVKIGCANTQDLLNRFNELASDKKVPNMALCDAFDTEIQQGSNMKLYDQLLKTTVKHIQEESQRQSDQDRESHDFTMPKQEEHPNSINDFELVTWLVVKR